MTTKAWHDAAHLGQGLNTVFLKMLKLVKSADEVEQLVKLGNSMGQVAMQITNVKNASMVETKIDKIEKLLKYIPQDVMIKALEQVNEHK